MKALILAMVLCLAACSQEEDGGHLPLPSKGERVAKITLKSGATVADGGFWTVESVDGWIVTLRLSKSSAQVNWKQIVSVIKKGD